MTWIDLSRIDAIKDQSHWHRGWPEDFTLVEGALTEVGQLRVRQSGGNTFVEGCTAEAGVIDFQVELTGIHNLTAEHFIF